MSSATTISCIKAPVCYDFLGQPMTSCFKESYQTSKGSCSSLAVCCGTSGGGGGGGLTDVNTLFPIIGNGTTGNRVRLSDGALAGDSVQWKPSTGAYEIVQPGGITTVAVGAGGLYNTVAEAIADGASNLKIISNVTEVVVTSFATLPAGQAVVIYINPGVTWVPGGNNIDFTGRDLTIMGNAENGSSTLQNALFPIPPTNVLFNSLSTTNNFVMYGVRWNGTLGAIGLVNELANVRISYSTLLAPNTAQSCLGVVGIDWTYLNVSHTRIVGGGPACQNLVSGQSGHIHLNDVTIAGETATNAMTLTSPALVINDLASEINVATAELTLTGQISNISDPGQQLAITIPTNSSNVQASNLSLAGTLIVRGSSQQVINVRCGVLNTRDSGNVNSGLNLSFIKQVVCTSNWLTGIGVVNFQGNTFDTIQVLANVLVVLYGSTVAPVRQTTYSNLDLAACLGLNLRNQFISLQNVDLGSSNNCKPLYLTSCSSCTFDNIYCSDIFYDTGGLGAAGKGGFNVFNNIFLITSAAGSINNIGPFDGNNLNQATAQASYPVKTFMSNVFSGTGGLLYIWGFEDLYMENVELRRGVRFGERNPALPVPPIVPAPVVPVLSTFQWMLNGSLMGVDFASGLSNSINSCVGFEFTNIAFFQSPATTFSIGNDLVMTVTFCNFSNVLAKNTNWAIAANCNNCHFSNFTSIGGGLPTIASTGGELAFSNCQFETVNLTLSPNSRFTGCVFDLSQLVLAGAGSIIINNSSTVSGIGCIFANCSFLCNTNGASVLNFPAANNIYTGCVFFVDGTGATVTAPSFGVLGADSNITCTGCTFLSSGDRIGNWTFAGNFQQVTNCNFSNNNANTTVLVNVVGANSQIDSCVFRGFQAGGTGLNAQGSQTQVSHCSSPVNGSIMNITGTFSTVTGNTVGNNGAGGTLFVGSVSSTAVNNRAQTLTLNPPAPNLAVNIIW